MTKFVIKRLELEELDHADLEKLLIVFHTALSVQEMYVGDEARSLRPFAL